MNSLRFFRSIGKALSWTGLTCSAVMLSVNAQTNTLAPLLRFGPILSVATYEDLPIRNLPLTVVASNAEPSRIRVDANESASPFSPKFANILVAGAGTNWSLTLFPAANQTGAGQIALHLFYDDHELAQTNLPINLIAVDDAPQLGPIADVTVTRGETILPVTLTVKDPDQNPGLKFEFRTSNPELLNVTNFRPVRVNSGTYSLPLTPRPRAVGSATVVAKVLQSSETTNGGGHSSRSFVVTIRPERFDPAGAIPGDGGGAGIPVSADFGGSGGILTWVPHLGLSTPAEFVSDFGTNSANLEATAWVADFNGDGRPDLMLSGTSQPTLQIWLNDSTPLTNRFRLSLATTLKYAEKDPFNMGPQGGLADFDGDGDLDFIAVTRGNTAVLFENLGDAREFKPHPLGIHASPGIVTADFDGDGRPDFLTYRPGLVVSDVNGFGQIYRNRGDGGFELTAARFLLNHDQRDFSEQAGMAGAADFDGDGLVDVWFTLNWQSRLWLAVFLNRGIQGFEHVDLHPLAPANYAAKQATQISAAVADFDGDGRPDVMTFDLARETIPNSTPQFQRSAQGFLRNLGNGQLAPSEFGLPDSNTLTWVGVADLDGDGNIDPILARATGTTLKYINHASAPNPLPGAPSALQGTFDGSRLALSWSEASDGNQMTHLTYEVRVGTAPGRGDIVAALSDPATGRRLAWAPGNAGFNRSLTLILGPEVLQGTAHLYWSVQAVDASLAGGAFAPEVVVDVPSANHNEPPTLLPIPDVNMGSLNTVRVQTFYGDDHTPSAAIQLQVRLSRPDLLTADQALRFLENQQLSFSVVRVGAQGGTCDITVTAIDSDGISSSRTFRVTVPERTSTGTSVPAGPLGFATTAAGELMLRPDSEDPTSVLESSTDLVHWSVVVSPATTGDGSWSIAPNEPVRFYRRSKQ